MLTLLLFVQAVQSDLGATVSREVARQECRQVDSDEILVCGRRKVNERYRMPDRDAPFDPEGETESVMRERMSWAEGGEAGIGSCGPVGPGGWTGCKTREWERERQQSQWGKNRPRKW